MSKFFKHPTAIVDSKQIGAGTRIWAFTHVMENAVVGENCNIGEHTFIESGAVIGDCVTIKNQNMIWEGVEIEDGVFIGPNVLFSNDLFPRSARLREAKKKYSDKKWLVKTMIEYGASLGAGSVIKAGVHIGRFALIAAGSIVTKDVLSHALVMGIPAQQKAWVCQCGDKLSPLTSSRLICHRCQLYFSIKSGSLIIDSKK